MHKWVEDQDADWVSPEDGYRLYNRTARGVMKFLYDVKKHEESVNDKVKKGLAVANGHIAEANEAKVRVKGATVVGLVISLACHYF